jgi:hypothetical protein
MRNLNFKEANNLRQSSFLCIRFSQKVVNSSADFSLLIEFIEWAARAWQNFFFDAISSQLFAVFIV